RHPAAGLLPVAACLCTRGGRRARTPSRRVLGAGGLGGGGFAAGTGARRAASRLRGVPDPAFFDRHPCASGESLNPVLSFRPKGDIRPMARGKSGLTSPRLL